MTPQMISQIFVLLGAITVAVASLASYHFGKVDADEGKRQSEEAQQNLRSQIAKFQEMVDAKTSLIFQALNVRQDVWTEVEISSVPS